MRNLINISIILLFMGFGYNLKAQDDPEVNNPITLDCGIQVLVPPAQLQEVLSNSELTGDGLENYQRTNRLLRIPYIHWVGYDTADAYSVASHIDSNQVISALVAKNRMYDNILTPDGQIKLQWVDPLRDENNDAWTGSTIKYFPISDLTGGDINGVTYFGGVNGFPANVFELPKLNPNFFHNGYAVSEINDNEAGSGVQGFAYVAYSNTGIPIKVGAPNDIAVNLYNVYGSPSIGQELFGTSWDLKPNVLTVHEHEDGHRHSLLHTFNGGCNETNCYVGGDQICDTPPMSLTSLCGNPGGFTCTHGSGATILQDSTGLASKSIMSYGSACKDTITPDQADRTFYYLEEAHENIARTPAVLPMDSCDMGKPYSIGDFGTITQGGVPVGKVINFYANGYGNGWTNDDGSPWEMDCRLRGQKLANNGVTWLPVNGYGWYPQGGNVLNYPVEDISKQLFLTHPQIQPNRTYRIQLACTCSDNSDPFWVDRTEWSDWYEFTMPTGLPTIINPDTWKEIPTRDISEVENLHKIDLSLLDEIVTSVEEPVTFTEQDMEKLNAEGVLYYVYSVTGQLITRDYTEIDTPGIYIIRMGPFGSEGKYLKY